MTSIGTIIKEIIIPHRKGNIRLNPEFVVLDNAHIQGSLLRTDYQKIYGIDIYNSKNRHITIDTNKEKKFSLDIYQISAQYHLAELLNEFREGQFSTTLTSKQKLSLLNMLRKNRPAFSIGEEPLGKIIQVFLLGEGLLNEFIEGHFSTSLTSKQKRSLLKIWRKNGLAFAIGEEPLGKIKGHDIELHLDVERPYPPMLRRPSYPESLETRKEIEKHINELLYMDVIRKIGHIEIVEITTPVLICQVESMKR
ncbi:hypothetical protein O181_022245 [Austropuccinia psidii MF-1]|uniref:Uncharacterized protein n=1 Tax=Austropuccinia psidii MF-1 TaxID=1389203 RepID=A0A9Q3GXW6_9BASI|nr:hypothetical protein [Austropuccinia psidii MF-1]